VSGDGRFVAFESYARLLPVDRNSTQDIYVLDRLSDRLTLETVSYDGLSADGSSSHPRLSRDGRHLVFESVARNLVADWPSVEGAASVQIFLRDRHKGTTRPVSRAVDRGPGNKWSTEPDISSDGRWVAFESAATNLAAVDDANGSGTDVYLFDVEEHAISRVSVGRHNVQPAQGSSGSPSISGDGRYVAFVSSASLDDSPPPRRAKSKPLRQVFIRDVRSGTTRLVSLTVDGAAGDGGSSNPSISGDGRFVAFASTAPDLVGIDRKARINAENVIMFDTVSGQMTLVSRTAAGSTGNGRSRYPAFSGDGQFIAFESEASDLSCDRHCPDESADLNLVSDVYLFHRLVGQITRVSGPQSGSEPWWEASAGAAIDETGSVVLFSSRHPMDAADRGHDYDLFIRARPNPTAPDAASLHTPASARRR
jgi:Tol biopolymer transport system component